MLRVGYPAVLDSKLLSVMPEGVDLVPLVDGLDGHVDIDVWIPDPYPTRALRIWPHLRGVRLVPVTDSVNIPFVHSHLDEDGRLKPTEAMEASATAMLDELLRWTESMRSLRA